MQVINTYTVHNNNADALVNNIAAFRIQQLHTSIYHSDSTILTKQTI